MNVAPAWQKGYTGKGVVVSILDDGIQTNHPDLVQNYVSTQQIDINSYFFFASSSFRNKNRIWLINGNEAPTREEKKAPEM